MNRGFDPPPIRARTRPAMTTLVKICGLSTPETLDVALDAGADMIFPEALTSEAEVERCAREIRGPLHFNRTGVSPRLTLERLNELGIERVTFEPAPPSN